MAKKPTSKPTPLGASRKPDTPPGVGRPRVSQPLTPELLDQFFELLETGQDSNTLFKTMRINPTEFYRALDEDETLKSKYARARANWASALANQTLTIADSAVDAALARLKIDTRKWLAGKYNAKFNDKSGIELTGAGGGPVQHIDLSGMSDEELAAYEIVMKRLGLAGAAS